MNLPLLVRCVVSDLARRASEIRDLDTHAAAAVNWLGTAQDASKDGGVALRYSIVKGWDVSYPETTGYIIPTFIDYGQSSKDNTYVERARKMADWLLSIQQNDGSFRGGPLGSGYDSFAFDTGQIVFGLVKTHQVADSNTYLEAATRAGDWLVRSQEDDGAWGKFGYHSIPHAYYTRVAWALAELAVLTGEARFETASVKNVEWALSRQLKNGWFDSCGFTRPGHEAPYTHTIAYAIRGVLETGQALRRERFVEAAKRSADALLPLIKSNGSYAARYDRDWKPRGADSCLTGNAQLALVFLRLYEMTRKIDYLEAGKALNHFLCTRQRLTGPCAIRGAVAGSYPIWGRYQRFAFPNWAAKFAADSWLLEARLSADGSNHAVGPNAAD
jgi:uncharacterized protein YyaL (SSP411 family)